MATGGGNLFVVDGPTATVQSDLGIVADRVELSDDGKTLALTRRQDQWDGGNITLDIVALPSGRVPLFLSPYPAPSLELVVFSHGARRDHARSPSHQRDRRDRCERSDEQAHDWSHGRRVAVAGRSLLRRDTGDLWSSVHTPLRERNADQRNERTPRRLDRRQPPARAAARYKDYAGIDHALRQSVATCSPCRRCHTSPGSVRIAATKIYSRDDGNIYELTTGATVSKTSLPEGVSRGIGRSGWRRRQRAGGQSPTRASTQPRPAGATSRFSKRCRSHAPRRRSPSHRPQRLRAAPAS